MNPKRILCIVTDVAQYADGKTPTGLWLSELSHIYHTAQTQGWQIDIASPGGKPTHLDPESLKAITLDKVSKHLLQEKVFQEQLQKPYKLSELLNERYDCVYLTGGHGTMYDFPYDESLKTILAQHYNEGRIVAAICHGVGGLINVPLGDGTTLIQGKKITGFSWTEEFLARKRKKVPFNLEQKLKQEGANYQKSWLPMTSHVVIDGPLVTGQNPFSSKRMAKVLLNLLSQ